MFGSGERYDVIVSNPPYVTESEKQGMERNVLDWEPFSALFVPDNDPLTFLPAHCRAGQGYAGVRRQTLF